MAAALPTAPADAARLRVRALTKALGRRTILDSVGFELRDGELLGVIGPNGAGKTTLLECVAGLLPADEGGLRLGERELESRERTARLFYLPDAIAPWPDQSVAWALDYAIGFFRGRAALRSELVEALALGPLLSSRIGALSKGERKRALLAFALLTPQPVLLIDEPFEGLDLRQTREVAAALRSHAAGGRTLFLSIHQITDAARICDRLVLLSGGSVCGEGTLEELSALARGRGLGSRTDDLEEVFLALT
jgi:ABC-type multidrug transport system ATPase subunit